MNYNQMPMQQPLSPTKVNPYKASSPPLQNYYSQSSSANYSQNTSSPDSNEKRYTGRLKFFDDAKNYGFIIMDSDESDIFVHYDDLQKAGITK